MKVLKATCRDDEKLLHYHPITCKNSSSHPRKTPPFWWPGRLGLEEGGCNDFPENTWICLFGPNLVLVSRYNFFFLLFLKKRCKSAQDYSATASEFEELKYTNYSLLRRMLFSSEMPKLYPWKWITETPFLKLILRHSRWPLQILFFLNELNLDSGWIYVNPRVK